jgi:beta-lactamase class A
MVWPAPDVPLAICVYTQGGAPSSAQLESVFGGVGRAVAEMLA